MITYNSVILANIDDSQGDRRLPRRRGCPVLSRCFLCELFCESSNPCIMLELPQSTGRRFPCHRYLYSASLASVPFWGRTLFGPHEPGFLLVFPMLLLLSLMLLCGQTLSACCLPRDMPNREERLSIACYPLGHPGVKAPGTWRRGGCRDRVRARGLSRSGLHTMVRKSSTVKWIIACIRSLRISAIWSTE